MSALMEAGYTRKEAETKAVVIYNPSTDKTDIRILDTDIESILSPDNLSVHADRVDSIESELLEMEAFLVGDSANIVEEISKITGLSAKRVSNALRRGQF